MTQIAWFLVSVYGVPWTLLLLLRPLAGSGQVWVVLAWLLPTVWAPTVVALVLTRRDGAGAVRREVQARLSVTPESGRWLLLAGFVPPAAMALAVLTARAAGDGAPLAPISMMPVMIVLQLITGAVGEELGWRGFLLPRLGKRLGELPAAWVMAILWSLWHLPAFFLPGTPHHDLLPLGANLLLTAFFGVFLAFVFYRTGESVLATILAHLSLNVSTGFGGVQLTSTVFWWMLVSVFGGIALLVTIALPSRVRDPARQTS